MPIPEATRERQTKRCCNGEVAENPKWFCYTEGIPGKERGPSDGNRRHKFYLVVHRPEVTYTPWMFPHICGEAESFRLKSQPRSLVSSKL